MALEDAAALAARVERRQFPQGGDPGTDEYELPWTNAGMVRRIAEALNGTRAGHPDRVLEAQVVPGNPRVGFLGAVEAALTREAETGGGLFYANGTATVCVRFEIHGGEGPRRVTTREIDCPEPVRASLRAGCRGGREGQVHPADLPLDLVDLALAVVLAASFTRKQFRVPQGAMDRSFDADPICR
jgi:hypothetical protein